MKIVRMGYSRAPWRLVNEAGAEIQWMRTLDHSDLGQTVIQESVCGDTKAECTEKALQMLGIAMRRLATLPAPASRAPEGGL